METSYFTFECEVRCSDLHPTDFSEVKSPELYQNARIRSQCLASVTPGLYDIRKIETSPAVDRDLAAIGSDRVSNWPNSTRISDLWTQIVKKAKDVRRFDGITPASCNI